MSGACTKRLDDGKSFLPASGQNRRLGLQVNEACPSQSLCGTSAPLRLGHGRSFQRRFNYGLDRVPGPEFRFLLHVAHPDSFSNCDFPIVRFDSPRQNAQERGFPRPVRTDQPDPISLGNGERHVLKQRVGSEGFRNTAYVNQRRQ